MMVPNCQIHSTDCSVCLQCLQQLSVPKENILKSPITVLTPKTGIRPIVCVTLSGQESMSVRKATVPTEDDRLAGQSARTGVATTMTEPLGPALSLAPVPWKEGCGSQLSSPHHQIKQTHCLLFREHGWCFTSQDLAQVPRKKILSLIF